MAAVAYAAVQDPKGASVVFLVLGVLLAAIGIWLVLERAGPLAWVAIAAGAFIAGVGWLLRGGIR